MKKNMNYILYGIALIVILIPIAIQQSTGKQLPQLWEGGMLTAGIFFLIAGKIFVIRKKRTETKESFFMDIAILLVLIVMAVWIAIKEIF